MEIQRNQEFKVEQLAKDEAIQEVLGLASTSGCMYSFHLLCFLSLLQLPCFRWKTSQLRLDLLCAMRRITGQSGIERSTCAKGSRDFALMADAGAYFIADKICQACFRRHFLFDFH